MRIVTWIGLVLLLGAPAFASGPFDGSKPLVCTADDTRTCSDAAPCLDGDAEAVNLPALFRLDAKKMQITGLSGARAGESAPLASVKSEQGRMVLHGGQAGRSFTMVVSDTGHATIAVVEPNQAFVVFGECAAL